MQKRKERNSKENGICDPRVESIEWIYHIYSSAKVVQETHSERASQVA